MSTPDKPEGIKNLRKWLGLPLHDPDNQPAWLDEVLSYMTSQLPPNSKNYENFLKAKAAITTKIAEAELKARYDELKNINWGNAGYASIARQYVYDRLNELEAALKENK